MRIGFIGYGNMARAMIDGILKSGLAGSDPVLASARSDRTRRQISERKGLVCVSNIEAASRSEALFLAIKPQYYEEVISEIRDCVKPETILVSMAPGKTLAWLKDRFAPGARIARIMPNTPAMVGAGMTAVCPGDRLSDDGLALVLRLLRSFGLAEVIPEDLMDVATAVSGSSPAYLFLAIEAMADGAVLSGMPRAQAYRFAAQAVLGSAKMVLETGKHPAELKDMVCSPGGTTMEAVRVLEEKGLRSALIEAERACLQKARSI